MVFTEKKGNRLCMALEMSAEGFLSSNSGERNIMFGMRIKLIERKRYLKKEKSKKILLFFRNLFQSLSVKS